MTSTRTMFLAVYLVVTAMLVASCGQAPVTGAAVSLHLGQLAGPLDQIDYYVFAGTDTAGNTVDCAGLLGNTISYESSALEVLLFRRTSYKPDRENAEEHPITVGDDRVVFVVGYDVFSLDSKLLVGRACQDGVAIVEGETTVVEITLEAI